MREIGVSRRPFPMGDASEAAPSSVRRSSRLAGSASNQAGCKTSRSVASRAERMVLCRANVSDRVDASASELGALGRDDDEYIRATKGGTDPPDFSEPMTSILRLSEDDTGSVATGRSVGGAPTRSAPGAPSSCETGEALLSVFSIAGLVATISLVPPDTTGFAITRIDLALRRS